MSELVKVLKKNPYSSLNDENTDLLETGSGGGL